MNQTFKDSFYSEKNQIFVIVIFLKTIADFYKLGHIQGALTKTISSALYCFQIRSTKRVDKVLPKNLKRGQVIRKRRSSKILFH